MVEIGNQQIRYLIIGYVLFQGVLDMIQPTVGASCYFPWCRWLRHVERSRVISPHGWSSSTSINRDLTPRLIAPRDPISSNLTHWLVVVDTLISTLIFILMTYLIILVIITIPITILPIILWYVTPQVIRCSINFQQSDSSACCERERCGAPLIS